MIVNVANVKIVEGITIIGCMMTRILIEDIIEVNI